MSSPTVEGYIKTFQERKLQKKKPTPYNVFLEVNSASIYQNLKTTLGTRPKLGDVRTEFKNYWDMTSPSDKSSYEEAAIALGYVPPTSRFSRNDKTTRTSLAERLKMLREERANRK